MRKFLALVMFCLPLGVFAQNSIVQEGEFGVGVGAAHYFGDLNTKARLNRPKLAASIFSGRILVTTLPCVWKVHLPNWAILMCTTRIMNT